MTEQIERYELWDSTPDGPKEFVLYSDHVAARAADKAEIERLQDDNDSLHSLLDALERRCADQEARIKHYRARLEVDHYWQGTEAPGQLARVECEEDHLPDAVACRDETIKLLEARIAELEAGQDEAVRRDAERYRWLRQLHGIDTNTLPSLPWVTRVIREGMLPTMTACYAEELDSAVDAAIAAEKDSR